MEITNVEVSQDDENTYRIYYFTHKDRKGQHRVTIYGNSEEAKAFAETEEAFRFVVKSISAMCFEWDEHLRENPQLPLE